jgi:acetoacetyl-CoA reductase/3-oxoacyl-[acyl-carrier protein] reductase
MATIDTQQQAGTRGVGAAIASRLAGEGASVAAGFGRDREHAERFQEQLSWASSPISIHQGTIGSAADCRRAVDEVLERHGRLDILINSAGVAADRTMSTMSDDDWLRVLGVALVGAFFTSEAALGHMVERGSGRIVNVSPIVGRTGSIGQTSYAAATSGLFGLTRSLAREAALALRRAGRLNRTSRNVTVNAVGPDFIDTELLEIVPEKVLDGIRSQVPLDRLGGAAEIAGIVDFLAADDASYITGEMWPVNRGTKTEAGCVY